MRSLLALACLAVVASTGAGCSSLELRMPATRSPLDETSASPDLGAKQYRRIMVIPPSGSARGQFDQYINLFEREFLKNGITVISSAITGRVVMEGASQRKDEAAQSLSDAERALVMAKATNANALLQIGSLEWSPPVPCRFFLHRNERFDEVAKSEYDAWKEDRIQFSAPVLVFVGRLTDVESGEVMASFSIKYATAWDLPSEYVARVKFSGGVPFIREENWSFSGSGWDAAARERVLQKTIALVASRIKGK